MAGAAFVIRVTGAVVIFLSQILLARWIDRIKPVADDADGEYDPDDAYDGVHVADEEDLARADGDRVSVADVDPPNLQDPEPKD